MKHILFTLIVLSGCATIGRPVHRVTCEESASINNPLKACIESAKRVCDGSFDSLREKVYYEKIGLFITVKRRALYFTCRQRL